MKKLTALLIMASMIVAFPQMISATSNSVATGEKEKTLLEIANDNNYVVYAVKAGNIQIDNDIITFSDVNHKEYEVLYQIDNKTLMPDYFPEGAADFEWFKARKAPYLDICIPASIDLSKMKNQIVHVDGICSFAVNVEEITSLKSDVTETDDKTIDTTSASAITLSDGEKAQLKSLKILEGDTNGDLRLNALVTRAETCKMICAMLGLLKGNGAGNTHTFPDVTGDNWAYNYILTTKNLGIICGDENGLFRPDENISNQDVIKMIVSCLGYEPMADANGGYPDGYISIATSNHLINRLNISAEKAATRNDIAIIIYRALDAPLMVQTGFGTELTYEIMDGKNENALQTLRQRLTDVNLAPSTND